MEPIMETHAKAILKEAEIRGWPKPRRIQARGNEGGRYEHLTPKLLSELIVQSQALGGTVMKQFWDRVGQCHPKLEGNVERLSTTPVGQTSMVLFRGIDQNEINFEPLHGMAKEYLIHLGVAIMDPGGTKSGVGTPDSVSDVISMKVDGLLAEVAAAGSLRKRKETALKHLVLKRDGWNCPVTGEQFREHESGDGYWPVLAHVIPNSVYDKPDTMKCLAMFAGEDAARLLVQHLNSVGNVMNLESNAHIFYDKLEWGIETCVTNEEVKYIYRRVPSSSSAGPKPIKLKDGEEIHFGGGTDGTKLAAPLPMLCNIQLAVARVLKMSGAAEVIMQIMEDADDSDFPHVYIASDDFCDILAAKLLLKGGHA